MNKSIKELQEEYTKNVFRNYDITKEMKIKFSKLLNVDKDKIYVSGDSTHSRVSVNNINFEFNQYQYDFYAEYRPSCYAGTRPDELIEHNKKQIEKLKEIEKIGIIIYKEILGRDLDLEKFNISEEIKRRES